HLFRAPRRRSAPRTYIRWRLGPVREFGRLTPRSLRYNRPMSGLPLASLAAALNEALHRCDPVFSGAGPLIAAALILGVLVLVPKDERWKARGPTASLIGAIALTVLDAWLPEQVFGRNFHRFIAQFL